MGSSKSGNLDQLAQFSLPAALASGKVKLPESGAIGAMQGQAEGNKVAKEQALAAQMNQQVPSYMMPGESNQQMYPQPAIQNGQAQMNYLKKHLPYQDGGHVALRRKMFKLGGDVNTHGVGITSGLSYNTGGSVRQGYGKGDLALKGGAWTLKKLKDLLKAGKETVTKPYTSPKKYIMGDPKKISKYWVPRQIGRGFRGAFTGGAYGAPVGIASALSDR